MPSNSFINVFPSRLVKKWEEIGMSDISTLQFQAKGLSFGVCEFGIEPKDTKKRGKALIDVPRSLQNPHLDDKSRPRYRVDVGTYSNQDVNLKLQGSGTSPNIALTLIIFSNKVMQAPPLRLFPHSRTKVQKSSNDTKNWKFFLV